MGLVDLNIQPGIYTEQTDRGAKGRWKDGDHVRFYRGLPEKIGGWQKRSSNTFVGKCRSTTDWQTLSLTRLIGMGTHLKLYIEQGGTIYDITPLRVEGILDADSITTQADSTRVRIAHNSHGLSVGDYVNIAEAEAVGGITVDGAYAVTTVETADAYTITHSSAATSSATGGGSAVEYGYEVPVGNVDSFAGLGWGAGLYGASTYGTPRQSSNLITLARTWSLDTWGEDLIAAYRDGGVYAWDSSVGVTTRAQLLTAAPLTVKAIVVSDQARHLIALGAHDGTVDDPLNIRWCSSEDYTDWVETETNTAGSHRLDGANEIYCGIKTDSEIVILTDSTYASMKYTGNPYQFDIVTRGGNGGLVGPKAAKEFDGIVYWMAKQDFYVYDGRLRVLPCDVRTHVFGSFNQDQGSKVFAGANRAFGEVWWLYPSASSSECDRYVIFNVNENVWSYGTLARTTMVGDSKTQSTPYAHGTDGYIYEHEVGVDDGTSALPSSLESWDIEVGDGDYEMHMKKIVPDFKRLSGSIDLTLNAKKYPQATETISVGPETITSTTEYVNPNLRARQISIALETTAVGDDWRMGTLRAEAFQHGKR